MVSSDTNQPIAGPSLTQQRMLAKICKANKNRFQKLRVQILVCSTLPKTYQKHHHENSGFLSKCYYASQSTVLDIVFFIDWTSERSERVFYILYNGFWISLGRPIFEKLDFSVFFMSPPSTPRVSQNDPFSDLQVSNTVPIRPSPTKRSSPSSLARPVSHQKACNIQPV